ncbi:Fc receptor-like protein 5 [Oryzias melastigma]|uniref:Fc receptor-like protein 5 n=1 Tax=Oryzias melastigma TaxID=30732 RepID=A0A834L2D0_ORYME|nr:Fc receptor-like protein 5 [Oryzias melastigma]KAF6739091.1 Fc receptor-like protein 5 [Oryzias melastigma]
MCQCSDMRPGVGLLIVVWVNCGVFWLNSAAPSRFPRPLLSGPDGAFLNSKVPFRCFAISSSAPVMYQLMRNSSSLISTLVDLKGNQTAQFTLKITGASGGSYRCVVTAGGRTRVSNEIKLTIVTPPSGTRVTSDPSPPVAFEGSRVVLSCNVSRGSHLSYTWFFNRREVPHSGNKIVIERASPEHAGRYYCTAWSTVQNTRRFSTSTEVKVTIKAFISKPKISFFLFKDGTKYQANVTCWSLKGSPPVNFSLYVDDRNIETVTATESLAAWFQVDAFPGLDMGEARCRVKTELQEMMSEPVSLEVVPVGGNVKVELTYLYTAKAKLAAATLRCHLSRGTFPHISWLLNGSAVPSESWANPQTPLLLPHFNFYDQRQTLILTKLGPEGSGYYRCRARNSYDDSAPWLESSSVLVQVTDKILNSFLEGTSPTELPPVCPTSPTDIIVVTFSCFFALMLGVGSVFLIKMLEHNQALTSISLENGAAWPQRAEDSPRFTGRPLSPGQGVRLNAGCYKQEPESHAVH